MKPTDGPAVTLTSAKRPRIASVVMVVGASIVLLVSTADNYRVTRASRIALESELASHRSNDELERLSRQLDRMRATHDDWQHRAIEPDAAVDFQNELIAIARGLKCRVRHASLGLPHRKPWTDDIDPFESAQWAANRPNIGGRKASQVLAIQTTRITLEGSYANCRQFISAIQSLRRLAGVKSMVVHPSSANFDLIQLDMELMMFALEFPHQTTQISALSESVLANQF